MQERIIEDGILCSAGDLARLNIVDLTRIEKHWRWAGEALDRLSVHLVHRTEYEVIETNLTQYPQRDDFPKWNHGGGVDHRWLGELFWNYFHAIFDGELHFHDMPDFSGIISVKSHVIELTGDCGRVSPIAMLDAIQSFRPYSVWVSVLNTNLLVVLRHLIPKDAMHWKAYHRLSQYRHGAWRWTDEGNVYICVYGEEKHVGTIETIAKLSEEEFTALCKKSFAQ